MSKICCIFVQDLKLEIMKYKKIFKLLDKVGESIKADDESITKISICKKQGNYIIEFKIINKNE